MLVLLCCRPLPQIVLIVFSLYIDIGYNIDTKEFHKYWIFTTSPFPTYGCYTRCSPIVMLSIRCSPYSIEHRFWFLIALSIAFVIIFSFEHRFWLFIAWSIAWLKVKRGVQMGSHHATWDEMEVTRQINRSHILTKQPILESFYWLCWWSDMILRKIACDEYLNVNVMMITVSQYTQFHP